MFGPVICGIDCETTGLDLEKDTVTEIGWCVMLVGEWRPLLMGSGICYVPGIEISPEVTKLTGLTNEHLELCGGHPTDILSALIESFTLLRVEYIVAHNGEGFDKPMLAKIEPRLKNWPWIDTKYDVPYPDHFSSRRLVHLTAEHGFVNPWGHSALADVMTMLKLLSFYDFATIAEKVKSPWKVVQAHVSYDDRDRAKARRYLWERLDEATVYSKKWVKKIRECDLEKEAQEAGFPISVLT